jgi:TBC1 domain family protein 5
MSKLTKEISSIFGPDEMSDIPSFYIKQLLRSAWGGNMCSEQLRGLCWRILLGLLSPSNKSLWEGQLLQQVANYEELKKKLLPSLDKVKADPLSGFSSGESQSSEWNSYYKSVELTNFLKGDLDRLFLNGVEDEFFQTTERRSQLQSILFLWSLQHPSISYRQGMHEIAGVVYFSLEMEREAFSKLKHEAFASHPLNKAFSTDTIEAHTDWIFERIMCELLPLYDPVPTSKHGMENQPFVVQFCTKIQGMCCCILSGAELLYRPYFSLCICFSLLLP